LVDCDWVDEPAEVKLLLSKKHGSSRIGMKSRESLIDEISASRLDVTN